MIRGRGIGAKERLFLSYLVLITATVAAIAVGVGLSLRHQLERMTLRDLRRDLVLVRGMLGGTLPPAAAADAAADRLSALSGRRVTLIAPDGRVIGDSDVESARLPTLENHLDRAEIQAAREGRIGYARRNSASVGAPHLYLAAPLRRGGVLRIAVPLREVDAAIWALRRNTLTVGAVALLFAAVFSWTFSRAFTRPLREVRTVARALADGDLSQRVMYSRHDELGELGGILNKLAGELQQRLAQLEAERAEMQTLIDGMAEGVLALAEDGTVRRANPAARRIFSLAPGRTDLAPQAVARRPAFLSLVQRALAGGSVAATELQHDGRHLLATGQPLAAGGAVLVFLDVSELRRLEDARRDFVANASHELKTPLTAIRGYSETLLDDDLPPALRHQFAATVQVNAERLQRIVDDLLDLSRIESGGWRVRPELLPLAEVAWSNWEPLADSARVAGIDFATHLDDQALRVYADPSALRQIFTNLFSNAVRYSGKGGSVVVRARRDGSAVVVEVADTGHGIPAAHLPRIFERFYRVDPSRARAEGGTGLGLAIVRHLVERHGGRVDASSELGRGTVIRFTLPDPAVPVEGAVTRS